MKTILITFLFATVLAALANAAPISARYLRFEGYYTSNPSTSQHIGIHEIETYSNGVNIATTSTITANSGYPSNGSIYLNYLKDGNTVGPPFYSNRNNPGPASESAPHWVQMDFGSVKPIDWIKIYLPLTYRVNFGCFLSPDGINWTQCGRYNQVSGLIEKDPLAPWVAIQSAAMRPGTTLMDVVYRVNDPDDATVKTRALAFVGGERSFANVLKPVTFVEGTAAKLGDAIPSNANHTLTWDVGADWSVDLGQVKFEVLAMDGRGLLPIDWITIPAAGGNPALTISKDTPSNESVLDALFWQYADGDAGLTLANGKLRGNSASGNFAGVQLATDALPDNYAATFLYKRMNLDPALSPELSYASGPARAGLLNTAAWHAINRPYNGVPVILSWGIDNFMPPVGLSSISAISAGNSHSLGLMNDGTVVTWGSFYPPQIPDGLSGVTAISAGRDYSLALKSDGTVVAWGMAYSGQTTVPDGLNGVTAIAAGAFNSLALKSNGTVVSWGGNDMGVPPVPDGLTGVTAIAASQAGCLALKSDGNVVGWGGYEVPEYVTGVTKIAAGASHFLALKTDGTVVGWGDGGEGQISIPAGLSGVTAIAAGASFSVALKSDGTVVSWGYNPEERTTVPSGLTGVTSISLSYGGVLALKAEAP